MIPIVADNLPLLIFPRHRVVPPPKGRGFPPTKSTVPSHSRQIDRINPKLEQLENDFANFCGNINASATGIEPEMTLVLELAHRIDNLERAVSEAGLEWFGEWDIDIAPDEDFTVSGDKQINGRLFVSMVNQQGMARLLSLWSRWINNEGLPYGQTKWRDIFKCLKNIRRWGIEETLHETGMLEYFENCAEEETSFQIECFYNRKHPKRLEVEVTIQQMVSSINGKLISGFIDMPDIAFHAVKVCVPTNSINKLLENEDQLSLLKYPHVMYFRQAGQSITTYEDSNGEEAQYPDKVAGRSPVAAILDGVPNMQHQALKERVDFDDPFDLLDKYQPGERRHGTAMASLILHGDRSDVSTQPLDRRLHHVAIMQPNTQARKFGDNEEHFPEDCFCEDRIERAVRRMLENDGDIVAQAPDVKIINLSLGDETRPFIHTPSPWARVLDWLSWKYKVLFCVSAGNYRDEYNFDIPYSEYETKFPKERTTLLLQHMQNSLFERRLLAPAESINSLTVGSLHQDYSGEKFYLGQRVDLLPNIHLLSPVSRLGPGFRQSVKPEIYFPGGRQLYRNDTAKNAHFKVALQLIPPGQKVAWDSSQEAELSNEVSTRGTSNATALATRAGVQIYDVLNQLDQSDNFQIPDENLAVLIKTLLVHGSIQNREAKEAIEHLKDSSNSRTFRKISSRYLGYGSVNVERVLGCTEQRGTVIGFGEITINQVHEFRFPIPGGFSGLKAFRRMVVTLAWFSPINTRHRYLREAKLELVPTVKWIDSNLRIHRTDGEYNQVKKGTVQHEVLEGISKLGKFQQGEEIVLHVTCKKDATEQLDDNIPYGLAVTLEAAEETQIPVYGEIRQRLLEQVEVVAN